MQFRIEALVAGRVLELSEYEEIIAAATARLVEQPNLVKVTGPALIFGDLYGNLGCLEHI
jgi:hypothetical protein